MEDSPALMYQKQKHIFIELSGADLIPENRQLSDGLHVFDAIKLTNPPRGDFYIAPDMPRISVVTGEKISVVKKQRQINLLHDGWIPSGQRIALGIPLHPDQMDRDDWMALPGIGEVLADRIEIDRQKNGEFGSLSALRRVKGIGKKTIENLNSFF